MIRVPEKQSPSPQEVTDYTCNTEASLDGNEGRIAGAGEINHSAAEEQYTRTHSETDLEGKGVTAERQRTNQARRKAAEAAHEKGTKRVRGREWPATVKPEKSVSHRNDAACVSHRSSLEFCGLSPARIFPHSSALG